MTTGGWIFMIISWVVITAVMVFTTVRSLSRNKDNGEPDRS